MTLTAELLQELHNMWAKDPQHLTKYALMLLIDATDKSSMACHQAILYEQSFWRRLGTTTADIQEREQQYLQLRNALQKELDQL